MDPERDETSTEYEDEVYDVDSSGKLHKMNSLSHNIETVCVDFAAERKPIVLDQLKGVADLTGKELSDEFLEIVTERLETVFVGGYYQHFMGVFVNEQIGVVGQSFVHIDMKTATVVLLSCVRQDDASKYYHAVATAWSAKQSGLMTSNPHGWTECGFNGIVGDWVNIYWSAFGWHQHKHTYVAVPALSDVYASVDGGRVLLPIIPLHTVRKDGVVYMDKSVAVAA